MIEFVYLVQQIRTADHSFLNMREHYGDIKIGEEGNTVCDESKIGTLRYISTIDLQFCFRTGENTYDFP